MIPPTRTDAGGRAYLDLQNLARRQGRQTQTLMVIYVLERFPARLEVSEFADSARALAATPTGTCCGSPGSTPAVVVATMDAGEPH